jgi:hypothetical protein
MNLPVDSTLVGGFCWRYSYISYRSLNDHFLRPQRQTMSIEFLFEKETRSITRYISFDLLTPAFIDSQVNTKTPHFHYSGISKGVHEMGKHGVLISHHLSLQILVLAITFLQGTNISVENPIEDMTGVFSLSLQLHFR